MQVDVEIDESYDSFERASSPSNFEGTLKMMKSLIEDDIE